MRRHLIAASLIFIILGLTLGVWAQESNAINADAGVALVAATPGQQTGWLEREGERRPIELVPIEKPTQPAGILALPAEDACVDAPSLALAAGSLDSGQTDVTSATEEVTDPPLSCLWGSPKRDEAYRTVWYKFTAPSYGQVTIDTRGSNYDTVVAIHTGACGGLVELACNDDHLGFTAKATLDVVQGQTYFVEMADWQEHPPPGGATLSLSASMAPVDTRWEAAGVMTQARSRHATAVVGTDIYVLGGQSGSLVPPVVEKRVDRYSTLSGDWVRLADIPGPGGYSNTTAAYIDGPADGGRIYLPSGYTGNPTSFAGDHWAYDIAGNFWITATNAPWPGGTPIAWSAAVANPAETGYYLIGGLSSQPPFATDLQDHDEVFFYSVASDSWSTRPSMTTPRYAHTGALVAGRICVAGGVKDNPTPGLSNILLTNGECYTPGAGGWTLTGNMSVPRYAAGSAVGADGKWYVFGGIDSTGEAVPVVEVYDPATNNWTALHVSFDLGGSRTGLIWPDRAWPRGAFVGSTLWSIGGNDNDQQALPMVDKLFVASHDAWMPAISRAFDLSDAPDDTFGTARQLILNQPQQQEFHNQSDLDIFAFDLPATTLVTVTLTNIPAGKNYNLAVYSANKVLRGTGDNLGNLDESVSLMLVAGRYYVMVVRLTGLAQPGQFYQIMVVD